MSFRQGEQVLIVVLAKNDGHCWHFYLDLTDASFKSLIKLVYDWAQDELCGFDMGDADEVVETAARLRRQRTADEW